MEFEVSSRLGRLDGLALVHLQGLLTEAELLLNSGEVVLQQPLFFLKLPYYLVLGLYLCC